MKTFKNQAAQGDVLITRIDSLPEGLKKVTPESDGTYIITHSETGHNHVMDSSDINFYMDAANDFVGYLEVVRPTELRHLRSFDTHESLKVEKGLYKINRQRERIPEGFRKAAD